MQKNIAIIGLTLVLTSMLDKGVLNAQNRNEREQVPVAYFNHFIYEGKDSFYINHPLPADDYYYNPILPGWFSDPSICNNGSDYFMVTSTFIYYPGVPIFHSRDLVNWKQIGFVLDRESQLINFQGHHTSSGIFAPAISYNPKNKTYYMITTNVAAGNFYVKTTDPFGSWSDPIWIPEVKGIDPSFFFDDNGKAYILNNDAPEGEPRYDGHRAIKIRKFDIENEKVIGPEKILIDGGVRPEENPIWIEGPHMYKINGRYYLMSAEGGTGPGHSEVIMTGGSPMGEFKPWDKNPILTQRHLDKNRNNPVTCAGHADLVQNNNGEWWSVFLACRPIQGKFENLGRETFMMPVAWSEDDFPYMTQGEDLIPMIFQMKGTKRAENYLSGNFTKTYSFDSSALDMDWHTLRAPAHDLYSLNEKPGFLALKCATVTSSEMKTPAFVSRRMQHHQFECSTEIVFEPKNENDAAGMLLYKDESHQYFLSIRKSDKNIQIATEKISKSGNEILASAIEKKAKSLRLKVVSSGLYYSFYYSPGNKEWTLLADNIDAYYLSTANSFGFTGTTIGMYATGKSVEKMIIN